LNKLKNENQASETKIRNYEKEIENLKDELISQDSLTTELVISLY
jgi:hypothetical protein